MWKNKSSDTKESEGKNLESYYDVYVDTVTWVEECIIDNKNSPYETLVKWWSDLVEGTDVSLYIGQNISNIYSKRNSSRDNYK